MPTYDHGVSAASIGVTILTTSGSVYAARATAGITEPVAGSGVYHVAHPAAGTLLIFVFDNGVGVIGGSCYSDGLTAPANRIAPATPTDVTNAQGVVTTAITNKAVTPVTDLTATNAKVDAAKASADLANRVAPDNANIAASAASAASADGKLTAGRLARVDGAAQETVAATNAAAIPAAVKTAVEAAGSHLTLIKAKSDNLPVDTNALLVTTGIKVATNADKTGYSGTATNMVAAPPDISGLATEANATANKQSVISTITRLPASTDITITPATLDGLGVAIGRTPPAAEITAFVGGVAWDRFEADADGDFSFTLPLGSVWTLTAKAPGYPTSSVTVSTDPAIS